MSSAVLAVFRKEFRENLRERRVVVSALLFGPFFGPLLFGLGLSLGIEHNTGAGEDPVTLTVSHPERAPNLVGWLGQLDVRIQPSQLDSAGAAAAVRARRTTLVLLVPEDFGQRLQAAEPAALELYADQSDARAARDAARIAALIARYGSGIASLRLGARGLDPLLSVPVALHQVDLSTPASRSVLALGTLSYLMLLTMLMGGMYLAIDATAGERERGSLEPLLTLPVPRAHIALGKLLATCAYMSLSLALTVGAFAIVLPLTGLERFGMSANFTPGVALRMVAACLTLVPFGAALMTLVAALTRSYREAQTWLGLVLIVPTLPLAFAGIMGLAPTPLLMCVPSLGQHFLVTSLLRDEPLPASWIALCALGSLLAGALLTALVCRLYRREALLG